MKLKGLHEGNLVCESGVHLNAVSILYELHYARSAMEQVHGFQMTVAGVRTYFICRR